jgi:hypothetical protein
MTVEPVSHQSPLERRSLPFFPDPSQRVPQTELVAQRRLTRTLPLSITPPGPPPLLGRYGNR